MNALAGSPSRHMTSPAGSARIAFNLAGQFAFVQVGKQRNLT
jgi:hypothetical protein